MDTSDKENVDISIIGQKLAVYGTYLCNRQHSNPGSHICSFLVCPGPRVHHSRHQGPEISISIAHLDRRRQRWAHQNNPTHNNRSFQFWSYQLLLWEDQSIINLCVIQDLKPALQQHTAAGFLLFTLLLLLQAPGSLLLRCRAREYNGQAAVSTGRWAGFQNVKYLIGATTWSSSWRTKLVSGDNGQLG